MFPQTDILRDIFLGGGSTLLKKYTIPLKEDTFA